MITNKTARREYDIGDRIVAGVVLAGAEVKSLRSGRGNLKDAYAKWIGGELFLVGADIPMYSHYAGKEYDPKRSRKLLLKKEEILKIQKKMEGKPLTLVPLRLFFQGRWAKCELGIGRGKQEWEKREDIKKRDTDREIERALRIK